MRSNISSHRGSFLGSLRSGGAPDGPQLRQCDEDLCLAWASWLIKRSRNSRPDWRRHLSPRGSHPDSQPHTPRAGFLFRALFAFFLLSHRRAGPESRLALGGFFYDNVPTSGAVPAPRDRRSLPAGSQGCLRTKIPDRQALKTCNLTRAYSAAERANPCVCAKPIKDRHTVLRTVAK
jgi:hypothetical protein